MSFDDWSMVERFRLAVDSLAGLGIIQERLRNAFSQLLPLRFEDFPPEVAEKYSPIHEALLRGTEAAELSDQKAVKVAEIIVEISHRLTALYEQSQAKFQTQVSRSIAPPQESAGEPKERLTAEAPKTDQGKCKVFLHTRHHGKSSWTNETYDFARLPTVGEYLATAETSDWYKVQLVVHCPFPCDCDAEVYAVAVDPLDTRKRAMPDFPWER